MTAAAASFYVTGGTLRPDAPSYVERQADHDLFDAFSAATSATCFMPARWESPR